MSSDPQAAASDSIAHQQEPLIVNGDVEAQARTKDKVSYRALPNKKQLAILCIARLADPLAASSIQTYMFYQLRYFNPSASESLISTQAGILVGSKTAAQVCTGMLWGRLADSEWGGRKSVLMIGLLSSGIACIGYGFSKTFVSAVIWQVFGGAMSSNVGIVRCVVAELNPEKRFRTRALLLLPLFANAGMLLGPLIGGLLSSQHGGGTFEAHPYAPPNIFAAAVYAIAAIGVLFGLHETLESLKHTEGSLAQRVWNKITSREKPMHDYQAIDSDEPDSPIKMSQLPEHIEFQTPPKKPAKLAFKRIWTWNVVCTMIAHFIIAGHIATFTNLWAIFLSTPVEASEHQHPPFLFSGGLGMQPRDVGFAMSTLGAVGVVLQLVIYPKLNDRFGTVNIWRSALYVFPMAYALAPFPALVGSANLVSGKTVLVWLSVGFVLLLFIIGRTGVTPATTLLINDCTPHPSVRGTIHTAGTVIGNLSRSVFPVVAFAIFGKGLDIGVVGLGFWCLACLGVLACVASRWVTEGTNGKEIVLEGEEPANPPQSTKASRK
ncbi:MFS general substrate transporter [Mollisia scopiformis]|uniref:MFS general substrate transporter n=1 Tax=Mollisia scopiformis TaxID=149040 RepID=A0A194X351_MOLSC|nr:MFS general substrate transporter [Mollisia scopiformis]KUJ14606.1 MFS general substrate transporter [Mollisia scopiformis]